MARIKLRAPAGTTEANYGTELMTVHDDGTIMAPEEAVPSLTGPGGFTLADVPEKPLPAGTVELRGEPGDSFGWRGHNLVIGPDGLIVVPAAAVEDLLPHGLVINRTAEQAIAANVAAYSGGAAPVGLAIMLGEPGSGCSWGGQSYETDADGAMLVPEAAVADLTAHGFVLALPDTGEKAEPESAAGAPAEVAPEPVIEPPAPVEEPVEPVSPTVDAPAPELPPAA